MEDPRLVRVTAVRGWGWGWGNPFTCCQKQHAWAPPCTRARAPLHTDPVASASHTPAFPTPPRIHLARVSLSPRGSRHRAREVGDGAGAQSDQVSSDLGDGTRVLSFLRGTWLPNDVARKLGPGSLHVLSTHGPGSPCEGAEDRTPAGRYSRESSRRGGAGGSPF